MIDWDNFLTRAHLICAISGQVIPPGATFYSLLRWQDQRFLRADVSEDHWQPELSNGAVSWWRQQRPLEVESTGPRLLSPEILHGIFEDCARSHERPRQCLAWLLAWLLVRQKYFRFIDLLHERNDNATDCDILVVQLRARGARKDLMRIRDPKMNTDEESLLQGQLDDLFRESNEDGVPPTETNPSRQRSGEDTSPGD